MPIRFTLKRLFRNLSAALQQAVQKFRKGPTTQDLTKQTVFSVAKKQAFPTWEQWKHLPRLLTNTERWVARVSGGLLLLSLLVLTGRYLFLHQSTQPAVGGQTTEALVGSPQYVNPLYAMTSDVDSDLARLVFSGLMKYEPGVGLTPDLAQSYDISDDGKTYTFVLRYGAKWHDGNPVRVADVIATFSMIQSPEYKSPLSVQFSSVSVVQVDERTVQFILPEPFAPFLSTLTVGILPSHVWEMIPPRSAPLAELNLKPIGSGPYRFATFTKDKVGSILSYTLQRNPDYYADAPKVDHLTFKFFPDTMSALDAFNNKSVDAIGYIPRDQLTSITRTHDVELVRPYLHQYTALFFNQVHQSILKDLNVRQALAQAVPKEEIISQALGGAGRMVNGPILPGMVGYDETIHQSNFDLASAGTLLDTAGWKRADGTGVRSKTTDGKTQTLSLSMTMVDYPEFRTVADLIKTQWQTLGVDLTVTVVDSDTMQQAVLKEHDYDMLLSGVLLGIDPDPYPFWHSSQVDYPGLNIALYADKDADALLSKARKAVKIEDRQAAYVDFQVKLIKNVAAIFLYQPAYAFARSKDVKGALTPEIITPADRFADVTSWYIKTKRVVE